MNKLTVAALAGLMSFSLKARSEEAEKWFRMKHENELGLVESSGNTQVKTFTTKYNGDFIFGEHTVVFQGRYLRSKNAGVESANQWRGGLRYEKEFASRFSLVLGQYLEADKFTNILQRYGTDVGGKYFFTKTDKTNFFTELGGRHTRENFRVGGKNKYNSLRTYGEIERKWTPTFSSKLWLEYLPNFTQSTDWQLNSEASVSAAISSIFSIKTGYLYRYDNLPAGDFKKADRLFTTALVAKF